ncbi:Endonuclease/exonuclease/phosphatase, partial [Mycena amicta]
MGDRNEIPTSIPARNISTPATDDPHEGQDGSEERTTTPLRAPNRTRRANNGTRNAPRYTTGCPRNSEHAPAFFSRKRARQQIGNPLIKKNTRAHIKVNALNINGVRAPSLSSRAHKWHDIHRMMLDEKIGVLLLSETHLSPMQVEEIENSHMNQRLKIFQSHYPENPAAKGVAVVLNRQLTNVEGVTTRYLIPGKAMLVTIPWYKRRTLMVLALYAPAESAEENAAFWDKLNELWMTVDLPVPDTYGGDINLVEEQIDRLPHRPDNARAVAAFANFKRTLNMIDGWRKANPNTKAYTYTSTQDPPTHARLDRIYVSPELYKNCRAWEILDSAGDLTDHKMISVTISAPGTPYIGKGRYTMPLRVLEDKTFVKFAMEKGVELEASLGQAHTDEDNPQTAFAGYKREIIEFARERAKFSLDDIDRRAFDMEDDDNGITDTSVSQEKETAIKLAQIQKKINELESRQRARRQLESRVRGLTERDKISRYTVSLTKERKPRDTIPFLRRTDVSPEIGSRRSSEMAEIARNYHDDLQKDLNDMEEALRDDVTRQVLTDIASRSELPEMERLAEKLSEGDVISALKDSAVGKAAGMNGIPTEFWQRMKRIHDEEVNLGYEQEKPKTCDVIKILTRVYNDIEEHGVVKKTEFAAGWMCPIYKKKDVSDIANYRPITVLNSDYKVFTKALTNKL